MALDLVDEDASAGYIDESAEASVASRNPFSGKIVDIQGMAGMRVRTCDGRENDRKTVSVDGQCGQVIGWDDNQEKHIVHTFEGFTVPIDEKYLREYELPRPEHGGCDVVYPVGGSPEALAKAIADWLSFKGYCMVQMSESSQARSEAAGMIEETSSLLEGSFRQEIESAYLGVNNTTQVRTLAKESDEYAFSPLRTMAQQINSTLNALQPLTEEYFDYSCWASSSPWARVSGEYEDVSDSAPISEKDVKSNALVDAYERFVQGRKVCALYLIENAGGEIQLYPRTGSELQENGIEKVTIPISGNKMLLFRHDELGYAYSPKGPSLALQSWMLSDIPMAQQNLQIGPLTGVKDAPQGANAHVMSLDTKIPGSATSLEKFWCMFAAGTDTDSHWPATRWETEPYYTSGDDYAMTFKSYTCHGGFMNYDDMISFDAKFFGVSEDEALVMCPGQHHILDCGYVACYRAGHNRETMRGENIGCYLGDVGMDWHAHSAPWSFQHFGAVDNTELMAAMSVGITCMRLSHIFDLTGPVQTADTACSASLVALQAGHKALMHNMTDANKEGSISACKAFIGGGVNTLMTPMSYIGNCAAGMLSHVGRCWTFDRTADGYQRGEGTGCMYLKWSDDRLDMEERLACLVGSCTGHDGRSASLTAPNGPAQQDAIRRSMRMAGADASLISVCECHGTGTALGDPIEIGSLQGVMRGMRQFPLLNTSAKTNISHLEAGAGMAGVMKCVCMVGHSCGPPNCHLRTVNPNLITEGYPVFFQQELCDTTFSTTFIGVSSFGFGGTNSRADVYGRCLHGARNTGNVWTSERHELRAVAIKNGLRSGFKAYGQLDNETAKAPIYITGSWDAFQSKAEMESSGDGIFTFRIMLGDMRQERFQLLYGGREDRPLYPAVEDAGPSAILMGPGAINDGERTGNRWLIDGRHEASPAGTQYLITFKWQGVKSISWEVLSMPAIPNEVMQVYDYYVLGSWTRFSAEPMACISKQDGLYEAEITLSEIGRAKFYFQRSTDKSQGIYLDQSDVIQTPGAFKRGGGKAFEVRGAPSTKMKVQLSVINGSIEVSAHSDKVEVSDEEDTGYNWRSHSSFTFYVSGSFNGWKHVMMSPSNYVEGIYFFQIEVPDDEPVEYKVEVEGPFSDGLAGVSSFVPGSDETVLDIARDFKGKVGSTWEVVVDLNQDDPNRVIYHRPSTHQEKHKVY